MCGAEGGRPHRDACAGPALARPAHCSVTPIPQGHQRCQIHAPGKQHIHTCLRASAPLCNLETVNVPGLPNPERESLFLSSGWRAGPVRGVPGQLPALDEEQASADRVCFSSRRGSGCSLLSPRSLLSFEPILNLPLSRAEA